MEKGAAGFFRVLGNDIFIFRSFCGNGIFYFRDIPPPIFIYCSIVAANFWAVAVMFGTLKSPVHTAMASAPAAKTAAAVCVVIPPIATIGESIFFFAVVKIVKSHCGTSGFVGEKKTEPNAQ